jgi:precorrin-6A/cobalt-precorrin-6A reductase
MPNSKILILGGTAEASELANRAHDRFAGRAEAILSLAGLVPPRRAHACTVRTGGFGGGEGLEDYLRREGVSLVVDATHPFAARISENAYGACLRAGVPLLALVRPPWREAPGDQWLEVDDFAEAAAALPRFARRVLLVVGRRNLEAFAGLEGLFFAVRLLEPSTEPLPLKDAQVVIGRPPHGVEEERKLLRDLRIDTLVVKQSGGAEGRAKLLAAREERVKVVLIARPPAEPCPQVETVDEALAWLESHL